jgi:V/A-type H+-transporting ATPase subunit E
MALDDVKLEISKSAEQSAAAIMAEADAEIAKIMAQADAEISAMKEKEDKRLAESVERLKRQEISSAELESKKIVLAKKKEILNKAFAETLASLEAAPEKEKTAMYKKMVASAKDVIADPKVYVPADSTATAKGLGVSEVVKTDKIASGIMLENADGTLMVDMQYKTILQTVWDREMKALYDILFG